MSKFMCPTCGKNPARRGLIGTEKAWLACKACTDKPSLRQSKFNVMKKMKELATPFWKHMGLKANAAEQAQEKMMKSKGLTYFDLQRERAKKATFNAERIQKLAQERKLPNGPSTTYNRQ